MAALSLLGFAVVVGLALTLAVGVAALGPRFFPLAGRPRSAWGEGAWALAWRAMVDMYCSAILRRASIRWPRARLVKSGKGSISLCGGDRRTVCFLGEECGLGTVGECRGGGRKTGFWKEVYDGFGDCLVKSGV